MVESIQVATRDRLKRLGALGLKLQHHTSAVGGGLAASHQIAFNQARHQFHGAVVLDQQAVGQLADRDRIRAGVGANGQQGLVLLGGKAMVSRALFAERQELADGAAEFAERPIVLIREGRMF